MRTRTTKIVLLLLCALVSTLALGPSTSQANRTLLHDAALATDEDPKGLLPPPEGQIEGACGVAFAPNGDLYVSDYYHRLVQVFAAEPGFPSKLFPYKSQFPAGISPEGPCQLAFDSTGALYANLWHERVVRLKPTFKVFDEANSTGVAVDPAGNVYVNDRTVIAVYDSAGVKIQEIGSPASVKDAYGLAVFAGRVYVPDAVSETVQVFEPALSLITPVASIAPPGGFNSLVDAAVTVDPTNGNVLVLDNLQPGFEHPKGEIVEFSSSGTFLGRLKKTVIHGGPSGMTVDPATGRLFVTTGNSEGANVVAWGEYTESGPEGVESPPDDPAPLPPTISSAPAVESAVAASSAPVASPAPAARKAKRHCRARKRAHRKACRRHAQQRAGLAHSSP